jgi:hypothetical protein
MKSLDFSNLWSGKWDIPAEKLLNLSELQLHNRNYTTFDDMPVVEKPEMKPEAM